MHFLFFLSDFLNHIVYLCNVSLRSHCHRIVYFHNPSLPLLQVTLPLASTCDSYSFSSSFPTHKVCLHIYMIATATQTFN